MDGSVARNRLCSERSPADVIVGEMACLSGSPRSANVRRWKIAKFGRFAAMCSIDSCACRASAVDLKTNIAKVHSISHCKITICSVGSSRENTAALSIICGERLAFVRVQPGQTLFEQGEIATRLYLIRLGHVRVSVQQHGREGKIVTKGPGTILGEIGLLAFSLDGERKTPEEVDRDLKTQARASG